MAHFLINLWHWERSRYTSSQPRWFGRCVRASGCPSAEVFQACSVGGGNSRQAQNTLEGLGLLSGPGTPCCCPGGATGGWAGITS